MFSGAVNDTDGSAHVPLKSLSYTREKSLHIISMFSGAVNDTDGSTHVPLKSLTQEKKSLHIIPTPMCP